MKYKYDVTVIMPVLNDEKYLEESINSIINQEYDFNKIELLLIDDASTDKSTEICQKYSKEYTNIDFSSNNKNYGLSYTRNSGIKKAQGKYIMFVNGCDKLSINTINNLISFFEKNYDEIDLVTYPLITIYNDNKKIKYDKYSKLFINEDGIYSLEEYPYLVQTSLNIVVKSKNNIIFFDNDINYGEEIIYITDILRGKNKIGYVKNAEYTMNTKEDSSEFRQSINPYYIYDQNINFYELLVDKYKSNKRMSSYIQSLIIDDICLKIKNDAFLPLHLKGSEYDKAYNKLIKIINKLDTKVINNYPYTDIFIKYYIFQLQNKKADILVDNQDKYKLNIDDETIYENDRIEIKIVRMKIKNEKINIIGVIKSPLELYIEPNLYIQYQNNNNEVTEEKVKLFFSNYSYNYTSIKYNNFHGFEYDIDLKNIKEFKFYMLVNKCKIFAKYDFDTFSPIQPKLKRYNFVYDKYKVIYKPNQVTFFITNNTLLKQIKKVLKENIKYFKKSPSIILYRLLGHTKKEIWLYQDRGDIYDNGYIQYQHDINKKDGIKRYYIGVKNNDNIINFVKFKSFKHKILYLRSSKIITSFIDMPEYCPLLGSIIYYRDILHYDLVYLQHGILHAKLLSMYSKEYTEIDKIVISSLFEQNNLIDHYNYKKEDLILSGMPRMSASENRNIKSKKIVFAPSWRKYLIGQYKKGQRSNNNEIFINSSFYQKINNFLNSEKLNKILKDKDMTLEFKLHPIFKGYKDLFKFTSNRISISFDEIKPKNYAILITDFSSFQFDFAQLCIPIIYFLPDESEFNSGLHTYRELDLKYEEAFGKLCLDDKELLKELEKIINNNCQPEEKYLNRMKKFFKISNNPCEDIYQEIKKAR